MNKPDVAVAPSRGAQRATPVTARRWPSAYWLVLIAVGLVFAIPVFTWVRFGLGSELYSYTLLIPAVSAYMIWTDANFRPQRAGPRQPLLLALLVPTFFYLGVAATIYFSGSIVPIVDRVAVTTAALVSTLIGTAAWLFDRRTFRRLLFPLSFLVFMVPLPTALLHAIETMMQHSSAEAAHRLFKIADTPVFYTQLTFQLPNNVVLHVAPECSGIRSTLVLLVVSIVAGYFFLRSARARGILALSVIPIAIIRNGFRIFVIGELCVRFGPEMIDSFIHRRGGPIFFGLSLIPFAVLLVLLQRREARRDCPAKN